MDKTRGNIHRGRTNSKGKASSARHNDRNIPLENAEHIAPDLVSKNVIWKFDHSVDEYNLKTLDDYEQAFYEKNFSTALEKRNDKQIANRHKDRVQTMEQFRANPKYCPEEDIFNIGKFGATVDPQIVQKCFEEFVEWHKTHFPNVIFLDAALHLDEPNASPHIHNRQVWVVKRTDEDGQTYFDISQKDALAAMGIERPDLSKKESKYNNAKMTYTAICREKWLDIAESHGIEIEREPQDKSRNGLTLLQLKVKTAEEKLHKAEKDLDMLNSVSDLVKQQLAKDVDAMNSAKDEANIVKKQTEDYVRQLEPTPTKTVKKFGVEKEIPKTEDELKRDRDVLAAQAVLKDKDEVADSKKRVQQREAELADDENKMNEYVAQVEAEKNAKIAAVREDCEHRLAVQKEKHTRETTALKDKIKQLVKAVKDAAFAAVVQRAAHALERVPLPTATEMFMRNLQREKTNQKER